MERTREQVESEVEPVRIDLQLLGADAVAFHRAATELRLAGFRGIRTVSGAAREILRLGCLKVIEQGKKSYQEVA